MNKPRNIWWEYVINFAFIYTFVVGTMMIAYALSRELFSFWYYAGAVVIFLGYTISWILDKKRVLDEGRTTS